MIAARNVDLSRVVRCAIRDADLLNVVPEGSMLDAAQAAVLHQLTRLYFTGQGRIAELGAFTGGTTRIFGEALRRSGYRRPVLEVYDLFEHNGASRARLADHPLYEADGFQAIWAANTAEYADLLLPCIGDLRQTATTYTEPLETLYVDIVKHPSVIAPVVQHFLPRLRRGGLLIHQDYFHWQSPWVVVSTERLIDRFEVLGAVSNHMLVLRLKRPIPDRLLQVDDAALPPAEQLSLMRRAIARFEGTRAGLLRVSMINLLAGTGVLDVDAEAAALRADFADVARGGRVLRYLDGALRHREKAGERPIW